MDAKFVRPNKGLPLTFLIVGEDQSIGGEDIWLVMEFGYSKTFGALKSQVRPIEPTGLMLEQLCGWLRMINFRPSRETLELWRSLTETERSGDLLIAEIIHENIKAG